MKKISKILAAAAAAALCAGVLAGCSGEGLTGGVAATVNGVEIQEDEVTRDIQKMREQRNITSEESWGKWMAEYNYIPEAVRNDILDTKINNEPRGGGARDNGGPVGDRRLRDPDELALRVAREVA